MAGTDLLPRFVPPYLPLSVYMWHLRTHTRAPAYACVHTHMTRSASAPRLCPTPHQRVSISTPALACSLTHARTYAPPPASLPPSLKNTPDLDRGTHIKTASFPPPDQAELLGAVPLPYRARLSTLIIKRHWAEAAELVAIGIDTSESDEFLVPLPEKGWATFCLHGARDAVSLSR